MTWYLTPSNPSEHFQAGGHQEIRVPGDSDDVVISINSKGDDDILISNDEQHIPKQGSNTSANSNSQFVQLEPHSMVAENQSMGEKNEFRLSHCA